MSWTPHRVKFGARSSDGALRKLFRTAFQAPAGIGSKINFACVMARFGRRRLGSSRFAKSPSNSKLCRRRGARRDVAAVVDRHFFMMLQPCDNRNWSDLEGVRGPDLGWCPAKWPAYLVHHADPDPTHGPPRPPNRALIERPRAVPFGAAREARSEQRRRSMCWSEDVRQPSHLAGHDPYAIARRHLHGMS